jgi:hypothetical protein
MPGIDSVPEASHCALRLRAHNTLGGRFTHTLTLIHGNSC